MKKIILATLVLSSCKVMKVDQSIENVETLQNWIYQDYEWQQIPYENANNYFVILETVKNDLEKLKNDRK